MFYVQSKMLFVVYCFNLMRKSKAFSYEDNDVNINTFLNKTRKFSLFFFFIKIRLTYIPMPRIKLAQLLKIT